MATKQTWTSGGKLLSVNGKKAEDEAKINNRLTQAAYHAVTPAANPGVTAASGVRGAGNLGYTLAAGTQVGRPANFAGGDAAYSAYLQSQDAAKTRNLAYNTGEGGRLTQLQQGGLDIGAYGAPQRPGNTAPQAYSAGLGNAVASAYRQTKNAQEEALQAALSAIGTQKPTIERQYDDLAKQAYASYQKGASKMPYQTQNTATGAKDNLALQALLGYENTREDIGQSRLDALAALDAQIAQAKASGAFDLAEIGRAHV